MLNSNILSQNVTYTLPSDSISFSTNNGILLQNLWRNGTIKKSQPVNVSDSIVVSFNQIECIEGNDCAAIVSSLGDFAYLDISSASQYYVLSIGSSEDEQLRRYLFFDPSNNQPLYYIDSSNTLYNIISIENDLYYIINTDSGETFLLNNLNSLKKMRAFSTIEESLQDLLFDFVATAQNIGNTINDSIDDTVENITDGKFNSSDISNAKDIIDFLRNISNIPNALKALISIGNIEFFGNVHLSTGIADVYMLNAQLHASISNLPANQCSFSPSFRYERVADYEYTLHMDVYDYNGRTTYQKSISSDGDYTFSHDCSKYNHGYFFESKLALSVTVETDMDALYEFCKQDWPPQTPKPTGKRYRKTGWIINGGTRNFKTDAPDICGSWSAVWHTTPPNAKLLTMILTEDGTCTQTYYYANRGENVTYTCNYTYNYPTLILNKSNGDIQYWEVTDYTPNSMTLTASDGFCYFLSK